MFQNLIFLCYYHILCCFLCMFHDFLDLNLQISKWSMNFFFFFFFLAAFVFDDFHLCFSWVQFLCFFLFLRFCGLVMFVFDCSDWSWMEDWRFSTWIGFETGDSTISTLTESEIANSSDSRFDRSEMGDLRGTGLSAFELSDSIDSRIGGSDLSDPRSGGSELCDSAGSVFFYFFVLFLFFVFFSCFFSHHQWLVVVSLHHFWGTVSNWWFSVFPSCTCWYYFSS